MNGSGIVNGIIVYAGYKIISQIDAYEKVQIEISCIILEDLGGGKNLLNHQRVLPKNQ